MPAASLEIFPERPAGMRRALATVAEFGPGGAGFVSVTSSRMDYTKTLALCSRLNQDGQSAAAHLLCSNRLRRQLEAMIDATVVSGIKKVLALRGDLSESGEEGDRVSDTCELITMLRERGEFHEIMVGGYPDVHPDAADSAADFAYLREKLAAGAQRVITQFSFDVDSICAFRDRLGAAGAQVGVSAGLLPIRNFGRMVKFAEKCRATVPLALRERFTAAKEEDHPKLAQELLTDMSRRLAEREFDLHYYTLNSVAMVNEAWAEACGGETAAAS